MKKTATKTEIVEHVSNVAASRKSSKSKARKGAGRGKEVSREMADQLPGRIAQAHYNRVATEAIRTAKRSNAQRTRKAGKSAAKAAGTQRMHPRLSLWLARLARPFGGMAVKCPVNFNNAPSMNTMVATTLAQGQISVGLNQTYQIAMFAGNVGQVVTRPGDAESFHTSLVNIGGVNYSPGPLNYADGVTTTVGSLGSMAVLASGLATLVTSTGGNSNLAIANPLPITAGGKYNHVRWQMVGAGIRVLNITPDATRGGSVVYCHPTTSVQDFTTQREFSRFDSYTITDANSTTLEIAWAPRPMDLAFWHTIPASDGSVSSVGNQEAAIFLWLNSPAQDQTYSYEVICHWELAGPLVNPMATPTVLQPLDRGIVEPSLQIAQSADAGAHNIQAIAEHVASTANGMVATGARVTSGVSSLAGKFLGFN